MTARKKKSPPLATLPNPVLSRLSGHSDPIVLEPFDVTVWYSDVPRTPNLLKISSDIESDFRKGFSAHYTQIWKLNRISMTIIYKVARKCIWCCWMCGQNCAMERESVCKHDEIASSDEFTSPYVMCQYDGVVIYTYISNRSWTDWGRDGLYLACPFWTLVVLCRVFTFIMCLIILIWLTFGILFLHLSTSLNWMFLPTNIHFWTTDWIIYNGPPDIHAKLRIMESQKRINPIILDIHDWIMDIHGWIMNIHNWIMDIHDLIMDIHNWIIDIPNSIMDIHNYRVFALLTFHGKPKAHKPYNYGYP